MKFFSLLYEKDVHPATDKKVIPANEFSTLVEAVDVLNEAKQDAQKKRKETEKECQELTEKAKEEGFAEGLQKFSEQIVYLENQLKAIRHNMQQMVLPIALKAAKRIVGRELKSDPNTIVDIVLQAIAPINQSARITIYVCKEDKEILEQHKPKLKEKLDQTDVLTIQEKSDISPGGCIIQTEGGMINATIENQWRALERAFEKYTPNP